MSGVTWANQVSGVVRSAGERTHAACAQLLTQQLGAGAALTTIQQRPFAATLAAGLRHGLAAGRPWSLQLDADVLLLPGALNRLMAAAAQLGPEVAAVQGLVFDRLFGGWRPAGLHLYRTAHLPQALRLCPAVATEIRPETQLLQRLAEQGQPWVQLELGCGLHDFEQQPHDLFRKSFVHAWKHVELLPALLPYWRARRTEREFAAALAGLAAGIAHTGSVQLDSGAAEFAVAAQWPPLPPLPPPTAELPTQLLAAETERLAQLGYRQAPVWDWAENEWARSGRQHALDQLVGRLLERGLRRCSLLLEEPVVAGQLGRQLTAWGIALSTTEEAPHRLRWHPPATLEWLAPGGQREQWQLSDHRLSAELAIAQLVLRLQRAGVRRLLIYGAGEVGAGLQQALSGVGITVAAFIESNPQGDHGPAGTALLNPASALARHPSLPVALASLGSAPQLARRLLALAPERPLWVVG